MKKRQNITRPPDPEATLQIRSLAAGYSPGYVIPSHAHDWHQLVYASNGVMIINTARGSWVVPSRRAVWVPAGTEHEVEMLGRVAMRTLYLKEEISESLPSECCVVDVSPLLRELILQVIEIGMLDRKVSSHRRLIGVIIDQLRAVRAVPLKLPMPADRRALRVAQLLREGKYQEKSLDQISKVAGASKRTIERLFQRETGLTFGKWRQQLRLLRALSRLADGEPVTAVALDVGYESPSAFISVFKKSLGTTPSRYYRDNKRRSI